MKNLNFIEKRMKNRKFVLKHISIGIQKESEEMVVKKKSDFDGMEFYLYISCSCGENNAEENNNGEFGRNRIDRNGSMEKIRGKPAETHNY